MRKGFPACWQTVPQRKTAAADIGMTDDPELTVTPPAEPARSAAAERMRLHRERRRKGLRCLTIELRETEIDALIGMKLLRAEMRNDPNAVSDALYAYFDRTLGVMP
jgi:hypothetical protein